MYSEKYSARDDLFQECESALSQAQLLSYNGLVILYLMFTSQILLLVLGTLSTEGWPGWVH